jgi:hypothetical protein
MGLGPCCTGGIASFLLVPSELRTARTRVRGELARAGSRFEDCEGMRFVQESGAGAAPYIERSPRMSVLWSESSAGRGSGWGAGFGSG